MWLKTKRGDDDGSVAISSIDQLDLYLDFQKIPTNPVSNLLLQGTTS
jgi:hypothetical protein